MLLHESDDVEHNCRFLNVIVKKLFLEKVVARKEVGSRSIAIAMNQQRRPTGEKVRE